MKRSFTFYVSGVKDNDAGVMRYIRKQKGYKNIPCLFFKLRYTAPYQNFQSIREFQCETKYRPFSGKSNQKKALVVMDVAEWIGKENEEYFEIFFKFLHDYHTTFYQFEYIFTAADADRGKIKGLYKMISQYLGEGKIAEDRTLTDVKEMSEYLMDTYPVDRILAERLASIFCHKGMKGLSQLDTIMMDLMEYIHPGEREKVTESRLLSHYKSLENSKFGILYEEELKKWKQETEKNRERGEAA